MRTKLKICGVTTIKDALDLVELGVDAIGINFYPKSKRYITPQDAKPFLEQINGKIERIGVFVDADITLVKQLITDDLIVVAQLHGNEDDDYCQELADSGMEFISVIRIEANDTQINIPSIIGKSVLLDTHVAGYGGAGQSFDWNLANDFIKQHPEYKVIIAGGITVENVTEAISINPHMIDVASGAETSPGIKNLTKVRTMLNFQKIT